MPRRTGLFSASAGCSRVPRFSRRRRSWWRSTRARAEAAADEVEPTELRELLYFLVDTVLDRQPPPSPEPEALPLLQLSTR